MCPRNIASTATRTAARSAKNRNGNRQTGRLRKILLVPARCRCRVRIRCRVVRNAVHCCLQFLNQLANVRCVASNCTPAGSARTSIPPADSSVHSRFRSGSRVRMNAIPAPFTPCGFGWKRRHLRPRRRNRRMPGQRLRIYSRSEGGLRLDFDCVRGCAPVVPHSGRMTEFRSAGHSQSNKTPPPALYSKRNITVSELGGGGFRS